ncbi:MAG TPA: gliding motility-associated C-terminal domain-containing protein [Vicingaceae bacterium]
MKGIRSKLNLVLTIVAFFMLSLQGFSQACDTTCSPNFVPNGSLENTTISCSDTTSEMHTDYSQVTGWFGTAPINGTGSTPDYYNTNCNGPSQTNTCDASSGSVGFFTYAIQGANAREYVQTQLTTPLVAGQEYCMSFDIKLGNNSSYLPSDGLGVWFTNQMVDIDAQNGGAHFIGPGSTINATPQIENPTGNMIDTNCTIFTANFIATGTEQWMVIGNFKNDANTQLTGSCFFGLCFSYFIIDNVSLRTTCTTQPLDITATTTNDTICNNECTNIEAIVTGGTTPYNITWNNGVPNGAGPHNVCPTTTTTYIATVTDSLNNTDTSSITIYVNPTDSNYSAISICANDSVFAGGAWQNTTGMYYDTLQNTYGCDSLLVTDLTVNPSDAALFNYPQNNYCITDANPTPTITGTVGGTFTINNSGTINSSTGEINIALSGVGTFNITYTTNGTCPDTNTVTITIVSSGDATITPAGPFCENDAATTLTSAQAGGVWSGNGITNTSTGVFDPSTAGVGTHQIIYTISGSCGDADTTSITINAQDDASFNYNSTVYCSTDANPTPTITGTAGGTFTIDNGGAINASTGEINIASSGVGTFNITYITNGACPDTNTVSIIINNCTNPVANFIVSDTSICKNECITITDASSNATSWQWTFNGGNPTTATTVGPHTVCFATVGTYTITLISTNSNGSDTATTSITVHDNPTVDAGTDVVIDLGQSTLLNAIGSNGSYTWTPPTWLDCPTCPSTLSTPDETITYTVLLVDSNGCTASDDVTVIVDFEYVIWVPNIFSPNGDGNNDVVYVRGVGVESFNFKIYNRWGEKVFETSDLNTGWDGTFRGKKLNSAVFVYYLEATFKNGSSTTKKGDITLIK